MHMSHADYHCDAYESYVTRNEMTITAMQMSHISRYSGYKNLSGQYVYSCCEGGRDISTIGGRLSENLSEVETLLSHADSSMVYMWFTTLYY